MIIKEFISQTNKNQMISTLLKYYKVGNSPKLRIVADSDSNLVPSNWKEVEGVGRDCDKPNVKFEKPNKTNKKTK